VDTANGESYFGDTRYSPFLSKFYAFRTMLGEALLIDVTMYTVALRRKRPFGRPDLRFSSAGLTYPVCFLPD
jgi:hypothetical protein